jgi:hypothetical protein
MPLVEIPTASVAAAVIPPPIIESQLMFISPSCVPGLLPVEITMGLAR